MSDEALKIAEALLAANIPYKGLSCNGVNLFGDDKSIDAAKRWLHDSGNVAAFRDAYNLATGRIKSLLDNEKRLLLELAALRPVVIDMLSGLEYLRINNSVPYGFGADRLRETGERALNIHEGTR